jgi:Protein of unknown function (DUF4019)
MTVNGGTLMRSRAAAVVLGLVLAAPSLAVEAPEDAGQAAAESWLKLVDAGDYDASWDQAAKMFKGSVTKEHWRQAIAGSRGPMGRLVSRKLKSREYREKLPGAPDGKYVVVKFDTVFEKKAAAVETVTPMMELDGTWHVSGYFIQ